MRVEDFYGVGSEITDADALEAALMQTHGEKVNEFWLSHGDQCYPGISLLVKGDFAALHYFPRNSGEFGGHDTMAVK